MMASGVVAGVALKDLRALGDFDIWVDEPDGGAAVDLTDPDIRPRKTHIRKQAFDDLDQLARADGAPGDNLQRRGPRGA
jgi:hypothetical protein